MDKPLKMKTALPTLALAGALLAGASLAEANPAMAVYGSLESLWPFAQPVSDAVMTLFILGGAVAVLFGIRARIGGRRP
jgi:hypothetical protein